MIERPVLVWSDFQGVCMRNSTSSKTDVGKELGDIRIENTQMKLGKPIPGVNFKINFDKPLLYEEQQGFTWHKSWLIPKITVTMERSSWEWIKERFVSATIQGELLLVLQRQQKGPFLQEIPLSKNTLSLLQGPSLQFSDLKFTKTSFQCRRQTFKFLFLLRAKTQKKEQQILISQLSSSVYVDSRREARLTKTLQDVRSHEERTKIELDQFFDPPKMFNGKRLTRAQNSIAGFLSYYTAQNIRNKIKDPLYIAYHFTHAFRCFVNLQVVRNLFEGMKIFQKGLSENTLITLVATSGSALELRKIQNLFEKSLRQKNVQFKPSLSSLEGDHWQFHSKKQIGQTYKEFFDDQEQIVFSSNSDKRQNQIVYEHTTEILVQKGGLQTVYLGILSIKPEDRKQEQHQRRPKAIRADIKVITG